jgi:hypothetical protein
METTKNLIKILRNNHDKFIEVQLLLNFALATHFIYYKNDSKLIIDEGIDGEEYSISCKEFYTRYKDANWIINQVV